MNKSLFNFKSILSLSLFRKFHIPDGKRIFPPATKSQKIPVQREDWRKWIEGSRRQNGVEFYPCLVRIIDALHFESWWKFILSCEASFRKCWFFIKSFLVTGTMLWKLTCLFLELAKWGWKSENGATHLCFLNIRNELERGLAWEPIRIPKDFHWLESTMKSRTKSKSVFS